MYVIILSGGVGSRLWPVSRRSHPKPFLTMPDGKTVLEHTFLRACGLEPTGVLHLTQRDLFLSVKNAWDATPGSADYPVHYMLEPVGKNTAAALAMASLWVEQYVGSHEPMLVMPSDHLILNHRAFYDAVERGRAAVNQNKIVVFGIVPTAPETGYGYIHYKGEEVLGFVEKPCIEKAEKYCHSGSYLWNAGIFYFTARTMLNEMHIHCPDILSSTQACFEQSKLIEHYDADTPMAFKIDGVSFDNVKNDSIDYAVLEKSHQIGVVSCDMAWSDIGNWKMMGRVFEKDQNNNIIQAEAITEATHNCFIRGDDRLIATIGIENLIIVDTPDALLVAHQEHTEAVKNIYKKLALSEHPSHATPCTVDRPWGRYTVLWNVPSVKIKRIEVHPGGCLSLQSHAYRSEHWVVVEGIAEVINNDRVFLLHVNESTYIAAGHRHRLSNPSNTDMLVVIEVQTGDYLGEDDIQRFEDIYDRLC